MATLGERHFCGGIGGYVGRRNLWLRWEKVIFVAGLITTLGEGHFCGGLSATLGEVYFVVDLWLYVGRRAFLEAGLVARPGEGNICGGIEGFVGRWAFFVAGLMATWGRRVFLWRDWWLRWEKGIFVAELVATLGEGYFKAWLRWEKGRGHFWGRD